MSIETVKKPKILILDDEPDILELYELELVRRGFQVLSAHSGLEGIKILESESVDLILTDFRMPNGNGLDVLRASNKIALEEKRKATPVIIVTGFIEEGVISAMMEGASAVHSKPISLKEIANEINEVLDLGVFSQNKRKYARKKTHLNVEFGNNSQPNKQEAKLANISLGGLQLVLKEPVIVNSKFNFKLISPEKKAPIHGFPLIATCLWQRKMKSGDNLFCTGFSFDEETKKEIIFINLLRYI